jgi:hypothetical protein
MLPVPWSLASIASSHFVSCIIGIVGRSVERRKFGHECGVEVTIA